MLFSNKVGLINQCNVLDQLTVTSTIINAFESTLTVVHEKCFQNSKKTSKVHISSLFFNLAAIMVLRSTVPSSHI